MSNVRPLFPNATDEEYEDLMLPLVIDAMQILWGVPDAARHDVLCEISGSLLQYVYSSMDALDSIRRDGYFDDNKLPRSIANAIDSLAADYARAMGGEDSLADRLRTRSPTKREKQLGKGQNGV